MPEVIQLRIPEDATEFVCSPVADGVVDTIVSIPKTFDKLEVLTLPSCKKVIITGTITSSGACCLFPHLRKLIIPAGVETVIFGTTLCDTIKEIVMKGPDCVIDEHSKFGKMSITMPLSYAAVDAITVCVPYSTKSLSSHYSKVQFLIMPDHGVEYYDRLYKNILAGQEKYNSKAHYNYLSNVDTTLVFDSVDDLIKKICDGAFDRILECVSLLTKHSRGANPKSTQLKFSADCVENDGICDMLTEIYENCESSIPVFRLVLKLGLAGISSLNMKEGLSRLLEKTRVLGFAQVFKSICDLFPTGDDLYIPFCKLEDNILPFASEWQQYVKEIETPEFYYMMYWIYFLLEYWLNKLLDMPCEIEEVKKVLIKMHPKEMSSIFGKSEQLPMDILMRISDIFYDLIVKYHVDERRKRSYISLLKTL